jgi:hypothetical protein
MHLVRIVPPPLLLWCPPIIRSSCTALITLVAVAAELASSKALVRDRVIASHISHLNSKLAIYHKGKSDLLATTNVDTDLITQFALGGPAAFA